MNNILVAYFSASGTTKAVAKRLATATNASTYEIQPEIPYSPADLDWTNLQSRSSVEMNDLACRPAIANSLETPEAYDTIFLGFPIWWYREPSIIDTFLESYDFTGKTIILFATSGSSGFGNTVAGITERIATGATIVEGRVLNGNLSVQELASWAKGILQ